MDIIHHNKTTYIRSAVLRDKNGVVSPTLDVPEELVIFANVTADIINYITSKALERAEEDHSTLFLIPQQILSQSLKNVTHTKIVEVASELKCLCYNSRPIFSETAICYSSGTLCLTCTPYPTGLRLFQALLCIRAFGDGALDKTYRFIVEKYARPLAVYIHSPKLGIKRTFTADDLQNNLQTPLLRDLKLLARSNLFEDIQIRFGEDGEAKLVDEESGRSVPAIGWVTLSRSEREDDLFAATVKLT